MPDRPKFVLLDVMDTLVHDPFFVEVPRFLEIDLAELFAVKNNAAWIAFEKGELDELSYLKNFFSDGRVFDHIGLRDCIHAAYRWLDGVEALLVDLRQLGYTPHALSNYPSWYQAIDARLELSRYLEWTFVSCRTGIRKPAPEAYLGAIRQLGAAPCECLFVDDREGNCTAAKNAGMQAIRFTGAESLRAALVDLGVLSATATRPR